MNIRDELLPYDNSHDGFAASVVAVAVIGICMEFYMKKSLVSLDNDMIAHIP